MPSSRRLKAKAGNSREMDMMSDLDNLNILIGSENINSIERELANTIEGSANHYETESKSHPRGSSFQEYEYKGFGHKNAITTQDRFLQSMQSFTNEINLRPSQEMVSMMAMMHSQIIRAISSAIAERVIPEIQNMVSSSSSGNRDTESGSSSNNQENNNATTGFKSKFTKKDCRSAFDLRDTEHLNPYTSVTSSQKTLPVSEI